MAGFGATVVAVQQALLEAGSAGLVTSDLMKVTGRSEGHLSKALTFASNGGLIVFWPEPIGRCANRRRWYAAGHRPPLPPEPQRFERRVERPARPDANGVTRWVDPRFHVEHAPRVVDSGQCRPWAAAAAERRP